MALGILTTLAFLMSMTVSLLTVAMFPIGGLCEVSVPTKSLGRVGPKAPWTWTGTLCVTVGRTPLVGFA